MCLDIFGGKYDFIYLIHQPHPCALPSLTFPRQTAAGVARRSMYMKKREENETTKGLNHERLRDRLQMGVCKSPALGASCAHHLKGA